MKNKTNNNTIEKTKVIWFIGDEQFIFKKKTKHSNK